MSTALDGERQRLEGIVILSAPASRAYAFHVGDQWDHSIEFFEDEHGDKPVLRWMKQDLSVCQRRALGYAMFRLL